MKVSEEVMEAMQRALEKDGFLQNIRAKLRSNVAKIIKEGEAFHRPTPSNIQFMKSQKGQAALLVVREFLLKLDLKESLLVFEAEAGCQPFQEFELASLSKKLDLPDRDVSLLQQLIDNRSNHTNAKPTSPIRSAKQPTIETTSAKVSDSVDQPIVSVFTVENAKSDSPNKSPIQNAASVSHSAKSTVVEEASYEEDDVVEEEFEPVVDEQSFEKAPSVTQPIPVVTEAKAVSPVSPKSPLADLIPHKGAGAKPAGSVLGALPDLKVPSRFNVTAADAFPAPTTSASAKDPNRDDNDGGPEIDNEIEEEEEPEEEDFSQLDQEAPEAKHADEKHHSGPSSRGVVVDSKSAFSSFESQVPGAGRANVQRVDAGSRSTRGWNLPADDQQEFDDSREDEGEDSVDQTQSASLARGPGRRTFPIRGSPQAVVPGRRSNHDNDALDLSSSQQLSVMEDVEDGFEDSHHSDSKPGGRQTALQASRRSNQEEEEEEEEDDDYEVDQTNDHDDDGGDNPYDLDGEDEFGDDDELPIGGYRANSSDARSSSAAAVPAPTKLFTASTNNNNEQDERKVNASAVEEEYGDDDFEQDEQESVMGADEEEEIPSIMEEEEISVGGQSNDDEDDWKKSSAPAAAKTDSGSMFQQRAAPAPVASKTARRHDFSALNDYSDDDDDEDNNAASVKGNVTTAANTAEAKRLADIDKQLKQMEEDDTNLRKIREDYGSNSNKGKVGGVLPDTTGDEISVASDSMVESFNADED